MSYTGATSNAGSLELLTLIIVDALIDPCRPLATEDGVENVNPYDNCIPVRRRQSLEESGARKSLNIASYLISFSLDPHSEVDFME